MNTSTLAIVFGAASVGGFLCGAVGQKLPPGRLRTVLLILSDVLPADIVGAYKRGASALALGALLTVLPGCGANSPTPAQQAEVVSYAAQEQACVALATTEDAADKCIAQVRALYCGPFGVLREAGACSYDGGIADAGGQ